MSEKSTNLLTGTALIIVGLVCILRPGLVYSVILNLALAIALLNGLVRIIKGYRELSATDMVMGFVSIAFGAVLVFYSYLPEWIIRVTFGIYCLVLFLFLLVQQIIYVSNNIKGSFFSWLMTIGYLIVGCLLLFTPRVSSHMLMQLFGGYFLLLGFRFMLDCLDLYSKDYKWKRLIHVSLPMPIAAIIPEWTLQSINNHLQQGREVEVYTRKEGMDHEPALKALVHVGPDGFQKVGHFSFAYKGVVYSYGNYDTESERLFGTMGDGVFFRVPYEVYLGNITRYENNTIFEYGIDLSPEQIELVDRELDELVNNSYRWYCQLERSKNPSVLDKLESDYPSRLHYRTGAKFYKIKKGKFKTYWAMGENCVLFSDQILGSVGADVLSIRGIITPGTYFDYLQKEYLKENSPVVSCTIHPARPLVSQAERAQQAKEALAEKASPQQQ